MLPCPLCSHTQTPLFYEDKRPFHQCSHCSLIFVPSTHHLAGSLEKERYDKHQNDNDLGHQNFLSSLIHPLQGMLSPGMKGLDFGSGPTPTLSLMLSKLGYPTEIYDPYYHPDVPNEKYDFITATEVVEHFCAPKKSWGQMVSLMKTKALLAVMTLMQEKQDFSSWWYKNDLTHVAFYSPETMQWIAKELSLTILSMDKRVTIFSLE